MDQRQHRCLKEDLGRCRAAAREREVCRSSRVRVRTLEVLPDPMGDGEGLSKRSNNKFAEEMLRARELAKEVKPFYLVALYTVSFLVTSVSHRFIHSI